MKTRLTALIALAAIVAVPAVASAATMDDAGIYAPAPTATSFAPVVVPRNRTATAPLFHAERNYLANACPTVSAHPDSYSSTLDRFCSEFQG